MPKNRKSIKTALRGESRLEEIYKFIRNKNKEDYQSYIVYPLVEDSESLELKAAETYYEHLKNTQLKGLKLGLIHGRMKWDEKEEKMLKFHQKEFDVLISTTVIEVGIDIPDANIILINDAHRFGLSQLHQLRGRVGRSDKQAYCILVTKDELIKKTSSNALKLQFASFKVVEKHKTSLRLNAMVETNDGFKIAERDLKLRGPGNIFGIKQSGLPELKFADIVSDTKLITRTKKNAFEIIKKDPMLESSKNKIIKNNLLLYYSENLKYASIA
jgi:ATP-dependent DNA helicase RecG